MLVKIIMVRMQVQYGDAHSVGASVAALKVDADQQQIGLCFILLGGGNSRPGFNPTLPIPLREIG